MSHRRLIATAVVLAASVAAVPGMAYAAGSSQARTTMIHAATATLPKASADFKTFSSPASHSVRTQAVKARAVKSQDAAATPDPSLGLGLVATTTSAYGLSLDSNITGAAGVPLTVTITWGDGTSTNAQATGTGTVTKAHEYAHVGSFTVTVTVTDGQGDTVANAVSGATAGSDFTAFGPTRLLDTRAGTGAPKAKVGAGTAVTLQVGGQPGIPAGVTAAVLNVTVTDAAKGGFITAYADGTDRPASSNVNFVAGQTVPNQVIVPVGSNGAVDLYNASGGTVDLIADIAGYFTASQASGYTPVTPYRLIDTRNATGTAKAQIPGHGSITAQVAGAGKGLVPSTGVTAVALNVTVTGSKAPGFLTVYPDGGSTPVASNVNFLTNQTIANAAITPVGADGKIRILNGSGLPTDVVVDVVGYYSAASKSAYVPVPPTRVIDTRSAGIGAIPAGIYLPLPLSAGVPDITGWVLNSTVTDTKAAGYLAVAPDPNTLDDYNNNTFTIPNKPSSSTLNWTKGATVANLVQASSGANGIIDFWNSSSGTTDVVIDAFGYYQND